MYSKEIILQEAEKCSKCGVCAGRLPGFQGVAAGNVQLPGQDRSRQGPGRGQDPYSSYTEDLFSKCLLCLTCKGLPGRRGPEQADSGDPGRTGQKKRTALFQKNGF